VPCIVWRARGCVRAVMFAQRAVVAALWDVVRACGLVCCMLRWSVRCAVCGLSACAVLDDTRDDADVRLYWSGACHAMCVHTCNVHAPIARLGRALPALFRAQWLGCIGAVLRLWIYVVACALLHHFSL
jgi:hypothetical protein